MHARAAVVAEPARFTTLRSAPPLTLRRTAPGVVHLVGSAAGPLGGDDLRLDVTVAAGARTSVRSVAASLAQPGPAGGPSRLDVAIDVGAGGALDWRTEPTILVRGCDHRAATTIALGAGATLAWREVVVLGRHGEDGGSLLQRLRVDLDGRPLVRNDLAVGPAWPDSQGPAGVGDARVIGTAVLVGTDVGAGVGAGLGPDAVPGPDATAPPGVRAARLALGAGAVMVVALGDRVEPVVAALGRARRQRL